MFTKKHFETLAAWIKHSNEDAAVIPATAVHTLIPHLRASNINFDRNRFIEACGWSVEDFDNANSGEVA